MIGQTISHYKITEKLGEGGRGVVYKAEDTDLKRPVALKFLAAHLLGDEEVKARFQREAEAAAALNHPNICIVHEIAEANGRTFIAMAFIEGEPVEKKIEAGPLKLKDALDMAIQTAQGLQAAHEKKIVHRDIKPANLMVTGSGTKQRVTIMDFGLALLTDRSKLTKSGTTLGTPIYMSPEQAQGEESDHHTDIWSLGVVLYEMVVGRPPFRGDYEQAVVYSILNEEPEPLTALRTGVPMEMERIVGKCMAKETAERYQHTDDLLLDLQTLRKKLESGKSTISRTAPAGSVGARHAVPTAPEETTGTRAQHAVPLHSPAEASEHPLLKYRVIEDVHEADDSIKYLAEDTQLHRSVAIRVVPESAAKKLEKRRRIQLLGWGLVTAALLAAAFVFGSRSSTGSREARVERFTVVPPERLGLELRDGGVSISPNGEHIAFVAGSSLWIQDLDSFEPRKIEGTEGARGPMWSPDSGQVAFATDTELRKVAVEGGPAGLVCALPGSTSHFTGSWDAESDSIVFAAGAPGRPYEVPVRGGTAVPVTLAIAEDERRYIAWPAFLPSGPGERRLLYWNGSSSGGQILTETLPAREPEVLVAASVWLPLYSVSGHLLYQTGGFRESRVLWALPLPQGLATSAEAFPIAQNTMFPSVSSEGTLAYVESSAAGFQPIWRSRDGEKIGEIGSPLDTISYPSLSPDEATVVVSGFDNANQSIWKYDIGRSISTRLTIHEAHDTRPIWSRDGKRITFATRRAGPLQSIFEKAADGTGEAKPLVVTEENENPSDWSPDGKYLLFLRARELLYLKPKEDGSGYEEVSFLKTSTGVNAPKFSPDGQHVVYVSAESGRSEIYVVSFPDGSGRTQISRNGGGQPRWSRDGKEIFYVEESTLMAVPVTRDPAFSAGNAEPLFSDRGLSFRTGFCSYDVTSDGERVVMIEALASDSPPVIRVVRNWLEEFKDRQQD